MTPSAMHDGEVEDGDALEAALEDRVLELEVRELVEAGLDLGDHRANHLDRVVGGIGRDAAGADVRVVGAQARDVLDDLEGLLAADEARRHDRGGAHLVAAGADRDEVRADAGELHHEHAQHVRAVGDVVGDAEQLLDAHAVHGLVEHRGDVVHAGAERDALSPGPELHVLLDAGVEVADARAQLGDPLALDLEHDAQHAVSGRVLGAHVEHEALPAEASGLLGDFRPVAAVDGELGCGAVVVAQAGGGVGCGVCPSSSPPPTCTACAGRGWESRRPCIRWGCRRAGSPCAAGGPPSRLASRCARGRGGRRR